MIFKCLTKDSNISIEFHPSTAINQASLSLIRNREALKDWIIHLDDTHYTPTVKQIEGCANAILVWSHEDPSQPPKVSKMWPYHFIKELPLEFWCCKQKPMDPKCLNSEDISIMVTLCGQLNSLIIQHGIQVKDIYKTITLMKLGF